MANGGRRRRTKISIEVSNNFRASICKCCRCDTEYTAVRQRSVKDYDLVCPKCKHTGFVFRQEDPWVGKIEVSR